MTTEAITGRSVGAVSSLRDRVTEVEGRLSRLEKLVVVAIATNVPQLIESILSLV